MDDVSDIADYYNRSPHDEHSRLDRFQLEYDLTWRFLNKYLPSHGTVLEVGAGSGRYTLELARRGYQVTAVDLSPALIELCRENLANEGLSDRVQLFVADGRDLREVTARQFDAALVMGPLYHLIVEADRKLALKEAYDRLRPGGIIFTTFISRLGVFGGLLQKDPAWIENQAEVRSLLENGRRPDGAAPGGFRGYFANISEIAPLHEAAGFETLVVVGVEPAISADDESYNRLQGKQRQLWLDLLYEISAEPNIIAASRHLLYIGKKK
jgi:S-adenosylmethionine-dependent methyltransferase